MSWGGVGGEVQKHINKMFLKVEQKKKVLRNIFLKTKMIFQNKLKRTFEASKGGQKDPENHE